MALTGYSYKCQLTVQSSKIPSDITNFPVLLTDANLPAQIYNTSGTGCLEGGGDIKFSSDSAGTTQLACEVVNCVRATPKIEIYVLLSSITAAAGATFYVWWGKAGDTQPAVTNTYGRNSVWTNYVGVYHLDSTTSLTDSTGKADGTAYNTISNATGQIKGGVSTLHSGTVNEGITYGTTSNSWDVITGNFTVEWWFAQSEDWNAASLTGRSRRDMIHKDNGTGNITFMYNNEGYSLAKALNCEIRGTNSTYYEICQPATPTWTQNAWSHCGFIWNYSGTACNYVFNGVSSAANLTYSGGYSWQAIASAGTGEQSTHMSGSTGDTGLAYAGVMDEIRWSNVARSVGFVQASYNSQYSPTTFISAGTVQSTTTTTFYIPTRVIIII